MLHILVLKVYIYYSVKANSLVCLSECSLLAYNHLFNVFTEFIIIHSCSVGSTRSKICYNIELQQCGLREKKTDTVYNVQYLYKKTIMKF